MAAFTAKLLELSLQPPFGLAGRITCPGHVRLSPGQYFLANRPGGLDLLPTTLFPADWEEGILETAPPLPDAWPVGAELALRGPLGKGFHLPAQARRVALAALETPFQRLLPLATIALAQQADVVFYTDTPAGSLPRSVEALPLSALPESLAWADYLALDTPLHQVDHLRDRLSMEPGKRYACQMELLLAMDFPCGGVADCGVCAVKTRRGWKLACNDGPVFELSDFDIL